VRLLPECGRGLSPPTVDKALRKFAAAVNCIHSSLVTRSLVRSAQRPDDGRGRTQWGLASGPPAVVRTWRIADSNCEYRTRKSCSKSARRCRMPAAVNSAARCTAKSNVARRRIFSHERVHHLFHRGAVLFAIDRRDPRRERPDVGASGIQVLRNSNRSATSRKSHSSARTCGEIRQLRPKEYSEFVLIHERLLLYLDPAPHGSIEQVQARSRTPERGVQLVENRGLLPRQRPRIGFVSEICSTSDHACITTVAIWSSKRVP